MASEHFWRHPEFSWVLLAVVGPLLWRPIRYGINHWRMYRRCRKYPQIIVCTTANEKPSNSSVHGSSLLVVGSLVTFIVCLPLRLIQFLLSLVRLVFQAVKLSIEAAAEETDTCTNTPTPAVNEFISETASVSGSTTSTSSRSSLKRRSALRKSAASSTSSLINSRVVFVEHSNGSVKTENYYYDPQEKPNFSVGATNSQTPEKGMTPIQPQRQRLHRIQTPPPRRVILPRRIALPEDKENATNAPKDGSVKKRPLISTQRRLSKIHPVSMVEHRAPLNTAALSEQMRKRRMEGEDLSLLLHTSKRPNHGRVALGAIRPRIVSARAILTKREREEREERILKDMNRKRAKVNETALAPKASSNPDTPTGSSKPAFQFGSTPTSAPAAEQKDEKATDPNPSFQFGTVAPAPSATSRSNSPPAASNDPTKPAFSFAGTPALAPTLGQAPAPASAEPPMPTISFASTPATAASTYNPSSAAASRDAPKGTAISFGSTPASATPAPAGGAPSPAAFSFGNTAPHNPGAPPASALAPSTDISFGSTPAPAPAAPTDTPAPPSFSFSTTQAVAPAAPSTKPAVPAANSSYVPQFGPTTPSGGFGAQPSGGAPQQQQFGPTTPSGGFGAQSSGGAPQQQQFGPTTPSGGFGAQPSGGAPQQQQFGPTTPSGGFGAQPSGGAPQQQQPASGASARRRAKARQSRRR
jgi:hypothetical protein